MALLLVSTLGDRRFLIAGDTPLIAGRDLSCDLPIVDARVSRRHAEFRSVETGVDITVIALWLGHEDPATTHLYIEADLAMKEAALRRIKDPSSGLLLRFRARDRLLTFLDAL